MQELIILASFFIVQTDCQEVPTIISDRLGTVQEVQEEFLKQVGKRPDCHTYIAFIPRS